MKESVSSIISYIPFIGLAMSNKSITPNHSFVTRLMEAGIIGLIIMYGTVKVLEKSIDLLKEQVTELRAEQKNVQAALTDVRVKVAEMRYQIGEKR